MDLASLVQATPSCALPCLTTAVQVGQCSLSALADCLCTNIALQSNVSTCVQTSCIYREQVRAALLARELCMGYPEESKGYLVRNAVIAFSAVTFPIVVLRCVSRLKVTRQLWWDDWLIVAASVFLAALSAVEIAGTELGFGSHYWNIDPRKATTVLQLFYTTQILYILVQVLAKMSLLVLIARIFPARRLQICAKIGLVFLVVHGLLYILLMSFQCIPVYASWDKSVAGKCLDTTAVVLSGAVFSIVEDLAILVLPIPELWKLKLSTQKKVLLLIMFSLGFFACFASMIRLKYISQVARSFDSTWDSVELVMWSMIEEYCAVLCACLPTLRPLLQKIPRLLGTTKNSSDSGNQFEDSFRGHKIGSGSGGESDTKNLVVLKHMALDSKSPNDAP